MQGTFFVIDGTDGSGKATQTNLLVERMREENREVETIAFPQYGQPSAGPIQEYLSGKYGGVKEINPYCGSILYAVDRFDASGRIRSWLSSGKQVVADRYVASNMGHQGSKLSDPQERLAFLKWNDELEFGIFGIPKPDINIILHVPVEISMRLAQEQTGKKGDVQKDIHVTNEEHLRAAEITYLEIVKQFSGFHLIECAEDGKILPREIIHERIWNVVYPLLS